MGLDNVEFELPLAGVGSRVLALTLDLLLLAIIAMLWILGGAIGLSLLDMRTGWMVAVLLFGAFLIEWGYFAGFELATHGQTPGKQAVGLRVVSAQGGQASSSAILIRNLLRIFDLLIGLLVIACDPRARRLGDLVAGTIVIHDHPLAAAEVRLTRLPAGWGAREIAVVESLLRRASLLEPARAQTLAERLLHQAERQQPGFVSDLGIPDLSQADTVALLRHTFGVA